MQRCIVGSTISMHACICVCVHVYMYVCIHVCMHVSPRAFGNTKLQCAAPGSRHTRAPVTHSQQSALQSSCIAIWVRSRLWRIFNFFLPLCLLRNLGRLFRCMNITYKFSNVNLSKHFSISYGTISLDFRVSGFRNVHLCFTSLLATKSG